MRINIQPPTEVEEIHQNVGVILGTRQGSQPMDRELGLSGDHVDSASTKGRALIVADIAHRLPEQEPRIRITDIAITGTMDGLFEPTVNYEVIQ